MAERTPRASTVFAVLCATAAIAIAGILYWATLRPDWSNDLAATESQAMPMIAAPAGDAVPARVFFRHNALGAEYGKLAWVDYGRQSRIFFAEQLHCETAYVVSNRGICMAASRGVVTTYAAQIFATGTNEIEATIPLAGVPSRTRVDSGGRLGATTVFVTGHGYDSVDFSTQTLLLNLLNGEVIADLETFEVRESRTVISNPDFNFWGVTFTPDSTHFFATLSTAGRHLLVKGNIADRTAEVVHEDVECPSLSPDGRRIAFKRRFMENGRIGWRLHVLDLAAGLETPLAEERSVDDQLEWFDNAHVLYSVSSGTIGSAATDVWVARADGSGEPQLFLRNAYSPAVVR